MTTSTARTTDPWVVASAHSVEAIQQLLDDGRCEQARELFAALASHAPVEELHCLADMPAETFAATRGASRPGRPAATPRSRGHLRPVTG